MNYLIEEINNPLINIVILNVPFEWEHKNHEWSDEQFSLNEIPTGNHFQCFSVINEVETNILNSSSIQTYYSPRSKVYNTKQELIDSNPNFKLLKHVPTPNEQQYLDDIFESYFIKIHSSYIDNIKNPEKDNRSWGHFEEQLVNGLLKEIYTYKYQNELWLIDGCVNRPEFFIINPTTSYDFDNSQYYKLAVIKGINQGSLYRPTHTLTPIITPSLINYNMPMKQIKLAFNNIHIALPNTSHIGINIHKFLDFISSPLTINFIRNEFNVYSLPIDQLLSAIFDFTDSEINVISNVIQRDNELNTYFIRTLGNSTFPQLATYINIFRLYKRFRLLLCPHSYLNLLQGIKIYNDAYCIKNLKYLDEVFRISQMEDKQYSKSNFKPNITDKEIDSFSIVLNDYIKDLGL